MSLGAYRLALDTVMRAFRVAALPVLRVSDWQDASKQQAIAREVAAVVRDHRVRAAEAAGEFMAERAAEVGGSAFVPPSEGYPDSAVEQAMREARSVDELLDMLTRHVETAARRTVVRAVPGAQDDSGLPGFESLFEDGPEAVEHIEQADKPVDNVVDKMPEDMLERRLVSTDDTPKEAEPVFPVGWARVPTGAETCAFCFMLASRGPVYSSQSHAQRPARAVGRQYQRERRAHTPAKGRKKLAVYPKMVLGAEQSYHDNCDCMVVPVYDVNEDWPGKDQYEALSKAWYASGAKDKYDFDEWLKDHPQSLPDVRKAA